MKYFLGIIISTLFILSSCDRDRDNDNELEIPNFNFPQTIVFEDSLSKYGLFSGNPSDLKPNDDFHLLELSSVLFTDYAYKQRLI